MGVTHIRVIFHSTEFLPIQGCPLCVNVFTLFIALLTGIFYFILPKIYLVLIELLIIGLLTRFNDKTKNFGKFVEILFIFYLIIIIISNLGINYPESLIIIFTVFIVLVFLEGPGWRDLYFRAVGFLVYKAKSIFLVIMVRFIVTLGIFGVLILLR